MDTIVTAYTQKELEEISTAECVACGETTPKLHTICQSCKLCRLCGQPRDGSEANNTYHHYVLDVGLNEE